MLVCAEPELLQGILSAVSRLDCTVLWSLKQKDQEVLAGLGLSLPGHVHAQAWLPQQDLLAHPAIKCFVTQAGTNSLLGALP